MPTLKQLRAGALGVTITSAMSATIPAYAGEATADAPAAPPEATSSQPSPAPQAAANKPATASKQESIGFVTGAAVGAAAGGPVGAILGAVAGGVLGDHYHKQQVKNAELARNLAEEKARSEKLGDALRVADEKARSDLLEETLQLTQEKEHSEKLAEALKAAEEKERSEVLAEALRLAMQRTENAGPTLKLASTQESGGSNLVEELQTNVSFRTNEATVGSQALSPLRQLGTLAAAMPGVKIRVAGYTDPRGSAQLNEALSRRRAEAVAAVLVSVGVSKEQLIIEGHGKAESQTVAGDVDGYALDRHVTISIERNTEQLVSRD